MGYSARCSPRSGPFRPNRIVMIRVGGLNRLVTVVTPAPLNTSRATTRIANTRTRTRSMTSRRWERREERETRGLVQTTGRSARIFRFTSTGPIASTLATSCTRASALDAGRTPPPRSSKPRASSTRG